MDRDQEYTLQLPLVDMFTFFFSPICLGTTVPGTPAAIHTARYCSNIHRDAQHQDMREKFSSEHVIMI